MVLHPNLQINQEHKFVPLVCNPYILHDVYPQHEDSYPLNEVHCHFVNFHLSLWHNQRDSMPAFISVKAWFRCLS